MPDSALIAGLGLIGGSAAMALRAHGWRVTYVDPFVDADEAKRVTDGRGEANGGHDVVMLATPVDVAVRQVDEYPGLVTSVCSVMRPLRAAGIGVAGHPLAGSEKRGLAAARADLFEGKPWFVDRDDDVVDRVIRDCGARKVRVSADEHDAALALTSHLPQVLSTALGAALSDEHVERFAGGGLETFLRLAGSDASVWAPILAANRDNIRAHFERVVSIARSLIEDDPGDAFRRANEVQKRLSSRS